MRERIAKTNLNMTCFLKSNCVMLTHKEKSSHNLVFWKVKSRLDLERKFLKSQIISFDVSLNKTDLG
jgi:hypothetical protein